MSFISIHAHWTDAYGHVPLVEVLCTMPLVLDIGHVMNNNRPGVERGARDAARGSDIMTKVLLQSDPARIAASASATMLIAEPEDMPEYHDLLAAARSAQRPWWLLRPSALDGTARHTHVLSTAVWLSIIRPRSLYITGTSEQHMPGVQSLVQRLCTEVWATLRTAPHQAEAIFSRP